MDSAAEANRKKTLVLQESCQHLAVRIHICGDDNNKEIIFEEIVRLGNFELFTIDNQTMKGISVCVSGIMNTG